MDVEKSIAALNNQMRRRILELLKDRAIFPPALPELADLNGVCVAYFQEKAKLSQCTILIYMGLLKQAGFVTAERHGQCAYYRCNDRNIRAFLVAVQEELLKTSRCVHQSGTIRDRETRPLIPTYRDIQMEDDVNQSVQDDRAALAQSPMQPCGVELKNPLKKAAVFDNLGNGEGNPTETQMRLHERSAEGGAALSLIGEVQTSPLFLEKPGNWYCQDTRVRQLDRDLARGLHQGQRP